MGGTPEPRPQGESWARHRLSGWEIYRRAIELLERDEWAPALRLLAAAETEFRTEDDQAGLWRALSGQAVAHWSAGDAQLAVARATAALRAVEAIDELAGCGLAAWQLAVMLLAHGDYRRAAELLLRAEQAMGKVGDQAPAGEIGAAARLCLEILRWQSMVAQGVAERRTATEVVMVIQRDLMARLSQAAAALRALPDRSDDGLWSARTLLLPIAVGTPALLEREPGRPSLKSRLVRWWRGLALGEPAGSSMRPRPAPPLPPAAPRPVAPPAPLPPPEPEPASPGPPAEPALAAAAPPAPLQPEPAPMSLAPAPAQITARVAVSCFGSFRVTIDDRPVERWEGGRARTIFKYLVVRNPAPVSKELLASLFWPESEPDLARRSLHQAIYCLRQSLKGVAPELNLVRFVGDCYQLNQAVGVWVDCAEFAQAIARARASLAAGDQAGAMAAYAVAADLVRGELLEEERYEAWAEELRHSYGAMYGEALHRLASYHHGRGDHATAVLHGQRILAHEPCDEEAHLLLMRSYLAQGLRHLAVRQYQLCVNTLRIELGLAPSGEIESFYRQVVALD